MTTFVERGELTREATRPRGALRGLSNVLVFWACLMSPLALNAAGWWWE